MLAPAADDPRFTSPTSTSTQNGAVTRATGGRPSPSTQRRSSQFGLQRKRAKIRSNVVPEPRELGQGVCMKKGLTIVHGISEHAYHVIPGELERISVSPERQALESYLGRIGFDRFMEFIADVLKHVEGHTDVEITNGPGDEKQDILSVRPDGTRQLTQCKHTVDYTKNTAGEELDVMLAACLRKNCRHGLWVTNADLTAPAKRYVTDREYVRGWSGPKELLPEIDYWNGTRIWERVRKSTAILNKWFSGMGQTSGLRSFAFDVVLHEMPSGKPDPRRATEVADKLGGGVTVTKPPADGAIEVRVDEELSFLLSDWARGAAELGLPYIHPGTETAHPNFPLATLRVQATVAPEVGGYDPATYRDRIVGLLVATLPAAPEGSWWYAAATEPQASIFLQDIARATTVSAGDAAAYVRVADAPATLERAWAIEPGHAFEVIPDPDDPGDLVWRHKEAGIECRVLTAQRTHVLSAFDIHLRQEQILARLRTYELRAVENAGPQEVDVVRHLAKPAWYVLQRNDSTLFWAFPSDADPRDVERIERVLNRRGIAVRRVRDEDREKLLGCIDTTPAEEPEMLTGSDRDRITPIKLPERIIWLSKWVKAQEPTEPSNWNEVVKWKAGYESEHGYDLPGGKEGGVLASEEMRGFLFDVTSLRGGRSLDVAFLDNKAWLNLRVRPKSLASASSLAEECVPAFLELERQLLSALSKPV